MLAAWAATGRSSRLAGGATLEGVAAGKAGGESPVTRLLVAGVLVAAIAAVAGMLFRGNGEYRVTAEFLNAAQLVEGGTSSR